MPPLHTGPYCPCPPPIFPIPGNRAPTLNNHLKYSPDSSSLTWSQTANPVSYSSKTQPIYIHLILGTHSCTSTRHFSAKEKVSFVHPSPSQILNKASLKHTGQSFSYFIIFSDNK